MSDDIQVMREYLSEILPLAAEVYATMGRQDLEKSIDGYYLGGLSLWRERHLPKAPKKIIRTHDEQLAFKIQLRDALGRVFPVQAHESIVTLKVDDDRITLVSRSTIVRESKNRITTTAEFIVLRVFVRSVVTGDDGMKVLGRWRLDPSQCLRISDPDFRSMTECGQYALLNTPDRWAQKINDYLECYRPGTEKTPLDSPGHESREDTDWDLALMVRSLAPEVANSGW